MRLKVPNISPRHHPSNFETKCSTTFHPSVFSFVIRNQIAYLKGGKCYYERNPSLYSEPSHNSLESWIERLATSAISLSHHLKYNGITTVLVALSKSGFYHDYIWEQLVFNLISLLSESPPKFQSLSFWAISIKLSNNKRCQDELMMNNRSNKYTNETNIDLYCEYVKKLKECILSSANKYSGKDIATFSSAINNIDERYRYDNPFLNDLIPPFKVLVNNFIQNKHPLAFFESTSILKASKILSHRPKQLLIHLVASMHLSLVSNEVVKFNDFQDAIEFLPSGRLRHSVNVDTLLSREISSLVILLCKVSEKFDINERLAIIIGEAIIRTRVAPEVPEAVNKVIKILNQSTASESIASNRVARILEELDLDKIKG